MKNNNDTKIFVTGIYHIYPFLAARVTSNFMKMPVSLVKQFSLFLISAHSISETGGYIVLFHIKIKRDGKVSDWVCFHVRKLPDLRLQEPEAVIVRLGDLYDRSPNAHEFLELELDVFLMLTHEVYLVNEKERIQDVRHRDDRSLDELEEFGRMEMADKDAEVEFSLHLQRQRIFQAMDKLSPKHRRRMWLRYYMGLSQKEIACLEGVNQSSVARSLKKSLEKIIKYIN